MAIYEGSSIIDLERYDVLYNTTLEGAARIQFQYRSRSTLIWFTGKKAGETEKIKTDNLVQKLQQDTWKLVLEKDERGRKTRKFFEYLFSCVDIEDEYTKGDRLPQFPRKDKYVKTGISYGLFDQTKELSDKGADILMHYIELARVYSRRKVIRILDREGVQTFVRHATRLSHPALYEYLRDCLDAASFTDEDEYTFKDYPNRLLIVKFDTDLESPEEKARKMKDYLQAKGFSVSYKSDSRFNSGINPRVLTIRKSNFNGTITEAEERPSLSL